MKIKMKEEGRRKKDEGEDKSEDDEYGEDRSDG